MCFSLAAARRMEETLGGLEGLQQRISTGTLAQQASAVNQALEILLQAGRVYASASGMELPDPLPCPPEDLIDVTDGKAINAIFSAVSADTGREVETVPKNQDAAQDR